MARTRGDNAATAMKSVVVDPQAYDWEGDTLLRHLSSRTIYEMHVKGSRVILVQGFRKVTAVPMLV
jgi:pullulanase/glycogen debranching enzyme